MREQDERERPAVWLSAVEQMGFGPLLEDSASLALAAHRVARARSRSQSAYSVPTESELLAAAEQIAAASNQQLPDLARLRAECEARGFPVVAARIAA